MLVRVAIFIFDPVMLLVAVVLCHVDYGYPPVRVYVPAGEAPWLPLPHLDC